MSELAVADFLGAVLAFTLSAALTPTERATRLLLAHLSSEQKTSFTTRGYFWVETRSGDLRRPPRRYALTNSGRIYRPATNNHFCIYGIDGTKSVPVADTLLACMLLLQYNERDFLSIANSFSTESQFDP